MRKTQIEKPTDTYIDELEGLMIQVHHTANPTEAISIYEQVLDHNFTCHNRLKDYTFQVKKNLELEKQLFEPESTNEIISTKVKTECSSKCSPKVSMQRYQEYLKPVLERNSSFEEMIFHLPHYDDPQFSYILNQLILFTQEDICLHQEMVYLSEMESKEAVNYYAEELEWRKKVQQDLFLYKRYSHTFLQEEQFSSKEENSLRSFQLLYVLKENQQPYFLSDIVNNSKELSCAPSYIGALNELTKETSNHLKKMQRGNGNENIYRIRKNQIRIYYIPVERYRLIIGGRTKKNDWSLEMETYFSNRVSAVTGKVNNMMEELKQNPEKILYEQQQVHKSVLGTLGYQKLKQRKEGTAWNTTPLNY